MMIKDTRGGGDMMRRQHGRDSGGAVAAAWGARAIACIGPVVNEILGSVSRWSPIIL